MKLLLILNFIILTSGLSFSQDADYQRVYIIGDYLNLRQQPVINNYNVVYQVHWGESFYGKKVNDKWYELEDWMSGDGKLYAYADYIRTKEDFIALAEQKETKNEKTKLNLFMLYIEKKNKNAAREMLISTVNQHQNKTILIGFEKCILLGTFIYTRYYDFIRNDGNLILHLENLKQEITDPLIINLIRLDQIDYWLKNGQIQRALKMLDKVLVEAPEHLFLPIACDYNWEGNFLYEFSFKNKYFIAFQLSEKEVQEGIWSKLHQLGKVAENKKTRQLAGDIRSNLTGFNFWKK